MADEKKNFSDLNNTPDTTASFDSADIEKNKLMGILSYLSILVLIPLFLAKESRFARYHVNQGLVLAIVEIIASVVVRILGGIPLIGWLIGLVFGLVDLACFILAVLGIVNVANGKAKELPIIGGIRILN